jgi:hypothetical protein
MHPFLGQIHSVLGLAWGDRLDLLTNTFAATFSYLVHARPSFFVTWLRTSRSLGKKPALPRRRLANRRKIEKRVH